MAELRVTRDALTVALPCLLVFRSLGQFALPEGALAVLGCDAPADDAATTCLAAAMRWFVHGLARTGISVHSAGLWFAATTAAIGIAAVFASAVRLLPSRGAARLCTLLAASCPAVAFAATSVHLHAAGFMIAAIATWAAVGWARSGASWRALLTGGVTGGAHALTPLGALLPLAVAPVLLLAAERPSDSAVWRWPAQVALALGTHLVVAWVALNEQLCAGMPGLGEVAAYDFATLLPLLAREWLRGCLPLSLVVACLLLHPRVHAPARVLHLALAAYLLLGCHATASLGDDGACLLTLVPAATLLVMRALGERRRLVLSLLLLSTAVAAAKICVRADWALYDALASGVKAVAQGKPLLLLTGPGLDEAILLCEPEIEAIRVRQVGRGPAPKPADLVADLGRRLASGQRVFVTPEAEIALRDPVFQARYAQAAPILFELEQAFAWRPLQKDGWHSKELVRR